MGHGYSIAHILFFIFFGTAILSTIALFTRQSLLVAYIALGAIIGPWGFHLVGDSTGMQQTGGVGIIFLLFLLGVDLQPQNLLHSLRKMSAITFLSSAVFFLIGFVLSWLMGYAYTSSVIIGIACMFSSTIIGIKLLPTTTLHHQHTGELMISILLLQDLIAIVALLGLQIFSQSSGHLHPNAYLHLGLIISAFPILFGVAYIFQRFILAPLLRRFDVIHEYVFILAIGWCLGMAELGHALGLSSEIGAFIAGITLASNPISLYIAESLKPLRDFFLVIFFFTIGAGFNFTYFHQIIFPACLLAIAILIFKPVIFNLLLRASGENRANNWEVGVRLGQLSEFSLLIMYLGLATHLIPALTGDMLEAAIIITFIVSCYWTVMRYPTPLAATEKLRRD